MAIDQAFACHAQGEGRGRGTAAAAATAAKQESFLCVCWQTCWLNEKNEKDATTRRQQPGEESLAVVTTAAAADRQLSVSGSS